MLSFSNLLELLYSIWQWRLNNPSKLHLLCFPVYREGKGTYRVFSLPVRDASCGSFSCSHYSQKWALTPNLSLTPSILDYFKSSVLKLTTRPFYKYVSLLDFSENPEISPEFQPHNYDHLVQIPSWILYTSAVCPELSQKFVTNWKCKN